MGYSTDCDGCGVTVNRPGRGERVVNGRLARRTLSDEAQAYYEEVGGMHVELPDHIPEWDHYCGDCADERGLR